MHGFIHEPSLVNKMVGVAIILLCIGAVLCVAQRSFRLGNASLAVALGGMTYPLYLLHNRIGKLIFQAAEPYLGAAGRVVLSLVMVIMFTWVVTEFVERRLARRLRVIPLVRKWSG